MENSFHGRTLATLTATGNRKVQAGFEPLVQGFVRVPYNDLEAVETAAANRQNIVAVLVEPIQGEGGINIPADGLPAAPARHLRPPGLAADARRDPDRHGPHRAAGSPTSTPASSPDVMTLAKGLGNGVPIGACLARGAAAEVFGPGTHGSTFGGNPLACRAAHGGAGDHRRRGPGRRGPPARATICSTASAQALAGLPRRARRSAVAA